MEMGDGTEFFSSRRTGKNLMMPAVGGAQAGMGYNTVLAIDAAGIATGNIE